MVAADAIEALEVDAGRLKFGRVLLLKRLPWDPSGVKLEAIGESLGPSFGRRPVLRAAEELTKGSAEPSAGTLLALLLGLAFENTSREKAGGTFSLTRPVFGAL